MANYSIQKTIEGEFQEVVAKMKESLVSEGFGVLTEINVPETLKKKLSVDYPHYVILGACNPKSAHAALLAEKEIGLLLPCNIIVYEDKGKITVAAIRPTVAMQMIENSKIAEIAKEVEEKLQNVIDRIKE